MSSPASTAVVTVPGDCGSSTPTVTQAWAALATGAQPFDIVTDASGNVYTTNSGSHTVSKTTPAGVVTQAWAALSFGTIPYGIAIDASGNIYTANRGNSTVSKITPAGTVTQTWAILATGANPEGIAIDASGNVYTANGANNTVSKITPAGAVTEAWATLASGAEPRDVATDASGNVYTANRQNGTVSKITPAGVVTQAWATLPSGALPYRIVTDASGNVYTTSYGITAVSKITPAGAVTEAWATLATGAFPFGIAIDASGNVYTANHENHTVSKITPAGAVTQAWATLATGAYPYDIAIDASGNVYTANYGNHTVSKIAAGCNPCPALSTAPPNVSIVNSTCQSICTPTGGSISAPTGTPCPAGSTLQYRVNGGAWSTNLPTYNQTTALVDIQTRCACDIDPNTSSPASTVVSTVPGTCTLPTAFTVTGGGQYCQGSVGVPVGLSGSQIGVSYSLLNNGGPTGNAVPGTGSTITFGNQINNGNYTVLATNTTTNCFATMNGGVLVVANPLPTIFTVTGGGASCSNGVGVPVGLNGSQTGVTYFLLRNGNPIGVSVPGTGSAITFGNQGGAGNYTVLAVNDLSTCTRAMSGSVAVAINPVPFPSTVTGGGAYCDGGAGVPVGLNGSQTGVNYQLHLNGNPTLAPVPGTGSTISFGNQTAAGIYTVVATNTGTSCTVTMVGFVTVVVNPLPVASTVTGGGTYCAGSASSFPVGLSASQGGVNYQLLLNGTPTGEPVAGTGSILSFGNQTATGTYTVVATIISTGCTATMTGSVAINPLPVPATPSIMITNNVCPSATGTITATGCGSGTVVEYALASGGPWSTTAPAYTATAFVVYARCRDLATNCTGNVSSQTTAPVACCPNLSTAPGNVVVSNGVCNAACQPAGASISAPTLGCPGGSTLQYSVNNGAWTTNLPTYADGLTIRTRCLCDADNNVSSPVSSGVTTNATNCVDNIPPTAVCSNIAISFNGQESIALSANGLVTASDNCGTPSVQISPSSISSAQVGQVVPVTVTVTDGSGNVTTCTANVTVLGLPAGWNQQPGGIGCSTPCTDFSYNSGTGVWTGNSAGAYYGPPFTSDAAAFAQRTLCGDGSISVEVTNVTGGGWAGIVMRESNAAGAKKAQLMTNLGAQNRREFRTATNGAAPPQQFTSLNRYWLRIVRAGNQFTMFTSPNGSTWYPSGAQTIVMGNCIQMGLVITNNTPNSTVTATFARLSVGGNSSESSTPSNAHALTPLDSPLSPEFEVFPNPTSGDLNVNLSQYIGRSVRMEVYSIEGKLLEFREIDEVQTTMENLNLSPYANGMYFIKVQSRDLPAAAKRVVLQRK
jgi:DNA-binding beta-propeller fold protein YncE